MRTKELLAGGWGLGTALLSSYVNQAIFTDFNIPFFIGQTAISVFLGRFLFEKIEECKNN